MNRIAMLRKEKGLSQISLSLKLNVSQKMISAYENGKSEPSIATLMQMADIFNTSVDYIIGKTTKHSFGSDFRLANSEKN
jgi:predicted transcriptional regulators